MDDLIEQMAAAMRDAEEHPFAPYEALARAGLAAIAAHPRFELVELPEPVGVNGADNRVWMHQPHYVEQGFNGDCVIDDRFAVSVTDLRTLGETFIAAVKAAEEAKG